MSLSALPVVGHLFRGLVNLYGILRRSKEGGPVIWLKIRHREGDGWRIADLMIDNKLDGRLEVKELSLGWSTWGAKIAPAVVENGGLKIRRDITREKGRTFVPNFYVRPQSATRWQNMPFYLMHPRDAVDNGRYTVRVCAVIEHATERGRRWKISIEGQLPQTPSDPVVFTSKGPLVP